MRELRAEDFARLGSDYLGYAQMHRRQGAPRFIDKMPNNFPSIGLLALIRHHAFDPSAAPARRSHMT